MNDETKRTADDGGVIDHLGADLWRAFRAYEKAMFERVNARGFRDVSLADSDVIVFISSDGAPLHEIAKLRGVTKQAVHEQIHGLVKRGYLIIEVDPEDRRARIVRYTNKGRALVESLKSIKRELHNEVANTLGEKQTMALRKTLRLVENLRFAKHDD